MLLRVFTECVQHFSLGPRFGFPQQFCHDTGGSSKRGRAMANKYLITSFVTQMSGLIGAPPLVMFHPRTAYDKATGELVVTYKKITGLRFFNANSAPIKVIPR